MISKNSYSELYLARQDVQKKITSHKNQIKMLNQLQSQLNSQIRQHLTQKAFRTIKGAEHDETIRAAAHPNNQNT